MPKENIVYEITGDTGEEYYTFKVPVIGEEKIIGTSLIGRGVVSEIIMEKKIEEFYKIELSDGKNQDISFPLDKGVYVKILNASTLTWLNRSEKDAREILKDKLLTYYQSALPVLLENVNILKQQLSNLQNNQVEYNDSYPLQNATRQKKKNLLIE